MLGFGCVFHSTSSFSFGAKLLLLCILEELRGTEEVTILQGFCLFCWVFFNEKQLLQRSRGGSVFNRNKILFCSRLSISFINLIGISFKSLVLAPGRAPLLGIYRAVIYCVLWDCGLGIFVLSSFTNNEKEMLSSLCILDSLSLV